MTSATSNANDPNTANRSHDHRATSRRNLWIALWLIVSFVGVEVVAGILANSLALLADAGHMVTDAAALALAIFAIWVGSRPASARLSFGFQRIEIIAASINAISLWLIAGWIFYDAIRRLGTVPEVEGVLTFVAGAIGLTVNGVALWILNRSKNESLNVKGAFLHVLGDALGSVGVLIAGLLIWLFGWFAADPIVAVLIGLIIVFSSVRLAWDTLQILMQATPQRIDLRLLVKELESTKGVRSIHDLHVWTVTSGYEVLTAHAEMEADTSDNRRVVDGLRKKCSDRFGIEHVTIQIDYLDEPCPELRHAR